MIQANRKRAFLFLITIVGAADYSPKAVPIAELWGPDATPKNCFEVLPAFGSVENGVDVSDWALLQDTSILSFDHEIVSFKRCFPYNSEKL